MRNGKSRRHFWIIVALISIPNINAQKTNIGNNEVAILPSDKESDIIIKAANVAPSMRQLRWQRLELTAFFHFGVNTFTDKEWGDGNEDPKLFNPSALDAAQWIKVCKESGIRQVIITAKHHDGFCLWPSKTTEHSVKNSPWKNGKGDVVKEVADACRKYEMGFGIYLSPWDRNSPFYGDSPKYNDYFVNQLTELLGNYGIVDEVWFDGACGEGPNGKRQEYDWQAYYQIIRKLQPDAVIAISGPDVRWVGTEAGYGRETEWSVVPIGVKFAGEAAGKSIKNVNEAPIGDLQDADLGGRQKLLNAASLIWYPAETDVSIRPGWFYHASQDGEVKSPEKLLDIYYGSVGRNGVLLLNIPPDKRGLIHENDVKSLKEFKKTIDETFGKNYLKNAEVVSPKGKNPSGMFDDDDSTYWTTVDNDTTATIEMKMKNKETFNVLSLQENIRIGQRIEKFVFEYWNGDGWAMAAEGTTVGYKRLIRFKTVSTSSVRLRIEASRLNPTLAGFGLYLEPLKAGR